MMNASHARLYGWLLILLFCRCAFAGSDRGLYGSISPDDYVTGRFNPARHELFVALTGTGIPTNGSPHRLRREAAAALKELYAAFRKDHPAAPFWVQSSTRSFDDQKYIWESKWTGRTPVNRVNLATAVADPLKRALEILNYSSMPGTSRHHWGTDFDLNVLSDEYFTKGDGKILYRWMAEHAPRYGFCQPYTAGRRSGYREEKWHWSYAPLARPYLARWNECYRRDPGVFSRSGLFRGSDIAGTLAPVYVNSINAACE